MKSGKQRRAEIMAARRARRSRHGAATHRSPSRWVANVSGAIPVDVAALCGRSWGLPTFAQRGCYHDQEFVCKDCGALSVWTAARQKWWYETAKGDFSTTAVRCKPCREKERARKTEARRVHLEGLAKKQAGMAAR